MNKEFKRLTDFLVGIGVEQISHTHKSYLAHLIGVYRYLESRGCAEDLCRAGMFHSIYGTDLLGIGPDAEFRDAQGRPYRIYRGTPIQMLLIACPGHYKIGGSR